ncbi:hypothetical protein Nmel_017254 [Mimus melanotis]
MCGCGMGGSGTGHGGWGCCRDLPALPPTVLCLGWAAGQDTGSGGHFDGAGGHTRLYTGGMMASFLPAPGSWRKPWHRKGQDTAGHCSHTAPGNGAGTRACPCPWAPGSGQPPAQPIPCPAMCHSGQRARRAGAGTSQAVAGAMARSEAPRGARGRRAQGQGRWMSPLCRVCPGLSLPRAPGGLRTRVCRDPGMNSSAHTHTDSHTDTRGPCRLRPRAISQLLAGRSAPAAPPRPALTFAQIPQGGRGEGIKREPRAAPASQSPAQP